MKETIKEVLIRRDGMDPQDADELIWDAKRAVAQGEDPEEVLADYFGLEPDWVFELIEE